MAINRDVRIVGADFEFSPYHGDTFLVARCPFCLGATTTRYAFPDKDKVTASRFAAACNHATHFEQVYSGWQMRFIS